MEDLNIVLIGVGALGSQIHNNLSRMGWGYWSLIDKDYVPTPQCFKTSARA